TPESVPRRRALQDPLTFGKIVSGPMQSKQKPPFDPKQFLSKVGKGRALEGCKSGQVIFAQGDDADSLLYIQKGKVKLAVVSKQGKEAVVAILEAGAFFGEGCLTGQRVRMATA